MYKAGKDIWVHSVSIVRLLERVALVKVGWLLSWAIKLDCSHMRWGSWMRQIGKRMPMCMHVY